MGVLSFRGKSKEEKEVARQIQQRKAKAVLQHYLEKLEELQKMVYNQGRQAARLGDNNLVSRQAARYLALQERIKKGQRMLLLMEEAGLQREMVKISGDFITFARDMSQSIAEGLDIDQIARMQAEMETALAQTERLDEALSVTLDMAGEAIASSGDFSEKNVAEIVKTMQGEAATEEKTWHEPVARSIKEVEDMMRRG